VQPQSATATQKAKSRYVFSRRAVQKVAPPLVEQPLCFNEEATIEEQEEQQHNDFVPHKPFSIKLNCTELSPHAPMVGVEQYAEYD
jgi:hypothetical protein